MAQQESMDDFDKLPIVIKQLVKTAVEYACEHVNDLTDGDSDSMTLNSVREQSQQVLVLLLDPEYANIVLPDSLVKAIDALVYNKVEFRLANC